MISYILYIIFGAIKLLILVVCLLSWVPIFNTNKEPIKSIINAYNMLMKPFKSIIPQIGMIDITPLVVFILIIVVESILYRILQPLGL